MLHKTSDIRCHAIEMYSSTRCPNDHELWRMTFKIFSIIPTDMMNIGDKVHQITQKN